MLGRLHILQKETAQVSMRGCNTILRCPKAWLNSNWYNPRLGNRFFQSLNGPIRDSMKEESLSKVSSPTIPSFEMPKPDVLNQLAELIPNTIEYNHRLSPLAHHNGETHPDIKSDISLATLMSAGLHLGHNVNKWNKNMMPYIFGERHGIHIINLEHTLSHLRRAIQVTKEVAFRGGNIVFVGTKPGIHRITVEAAKNGGHAYYVIDWVGGIITNKERVLRRSVGYDPEVVSQLTKMNDLDPDMVDEDASRVKGQPYVHSPDLLILLDYPNTLWAAREANQANIPIIALCDTDCDPRLVQYPIPGNDDSKSSVELIAGVLSRASREGFVLREKALADKSSKPRSQDRRKNR